MTTITVKLDDTKASLLQELAKKYGLLPDQFITASIEDILSQPDSEFEEVVKRLLEKNVELYKRLA